MRTRERSRTGEGTLPGRRARGRESRGCWKGTDILAGSCGLPLWGRHRQEWRQLVSRGGVGGPKQRLLAQPPATDQLSSGCVCLCVCRVVVVVGESTPTF